MCECDWSISDTRGDLLMPIWLKGGAASCPFENRVSNAGNHNSKKPAAAFEPRAC